MRITNSLLFCLIALSLFAASSSAEVRTFPLAAEESHITLLDSGRDVLTYRAEVGELAVMDVTTTEGTFSRLLIPGFHTSKTEGAPELPMMNRMIEVPYGAIARVEVTATDGRSINLEELGINNPLFPTQPSMPKNADPESWPFVYDRAAYSVGRVAQELVTVADLGRLRAVDLGRVELSPIEYFPDENRIVVYERIEFRIVFENADHTRGDDLKARTNSPFFHCLYDQIEGYRSTHDDHPDLVRDVVTMVVVVPPEFEAMMQEFVDWKTMRGFKTILAVKGTPEVGTTKEQIRDYIHGLYNNATPEQPAPSFVLFVGDVAQMPTFTEGGDATDRPYCDVEGDLCPDIYYGRFSATNPAQLQAILDKTLMYDQYTMPDPSYLGEVVMIAGMDGSHGSTWGNGQINYGTTYYFNEAHNIYSHTYLYPESGSNAANIVQNVSDGVGYINYTAHGSQTSWSDPYFSQSDINGLDNYGKYCLAVGNCCLTSTYDYGECFAETWLRAEGKGAIGYIGGSNSTYWDEDYWWGVGNTSSIISNPTYEQSGTGAYDGLFHDHGEAMDLWYVTNDAVIFSGNLAVMESGSSLTTYYWNIYNLMGDPSLCTYLGTPQTNPVICPETLFTTWTSFTIEAMPGSYVGLTKDGELIGAGMVGASGSLDLEILQQPFTPGTAHLVVMAQNCEPHTADLNVIVPASVFLDPEIIDCGVETQIEVGVFEQDGTTPRVGVEVWADGLDYESGHSFTDVTGYCTIIVNYPYGPSVDIVGQDPGEPYELFRQPLMVRASLLFMPNLWVTTDIGLDDTFALNLPGTLNANVNEPGHTLWAFLGDQALGNTTGLSLEITPTDTGEVTGIIAVAGYNLYTEDFPVIEAFGTLTGHVDADGSPAAGAIVKGYDDAMELVFETTANASGDYDVGRDILCAPYTIMIDYFGYLHFEEPFFVNYGANAFDINLDPAPAGIMSGTVREDETDIPLAATVKIYRSDTQELYAETISSEIDGSYETPPLPFFDYQVTVKAWHHIPVTIDLTVDQPLIQQNFWLEETIGDLLVIGDDGKGGLQPAKIDPKTGEVVADAYRSDHPKSVDDLLADLETLGYTTTTETMSGTDPAQWEIYDLMMVCSGDNIDPLGDAGFRTDLIAFVEGGGHLLIEGGEVGYDHYADTNFAEKVLHITDWDHDQSGNVTVADPEHYLVSVPNPITGPISMNYVGYGDHDANDPTPDAVKVGAWSSYPENASIIAYDPNPAPEGGQVAFYCFNYSVMDAAVRPLLLKNTLTWLMTQEIGNCSVEGTAYMAGETDHSGIKIEAIPGGGFVYTDATGHYELAGLFAGDYTIEASKDAWSTEVQEVSFDPSEQLTDVNFVLTPISAWERCRQSNLSIPDSNPTGVQDVMFVLLGTQTTVTGIEVYVDITHTYIGDLEVSLISPAGTNVMLHDRSGGSADDIVGWYPLDLEPAGDLETFIGEGSDGAWRIHVSDHVGSDVGTLNEWCLRIYYGQPSADVASHEVPLKLALDGNRPNPFNPRTAIFFDLPRTGEIDLAVFDVTGRRVATLLSGVVEAGHHEALWTGRDDEGHEVPGGIYFYKLHAEGEILTKKMVMLK